MGRKSKKKAVGPKHKHSPETRELIFKDWMENNKTYTQLALQYDCDVQTIYNMRDEEKWMDRKGKILEKVRAQNDKKILELKQQVFEATGKLIDLTASRISDIEKRIREGQNKEDKDFGYLQLINFVSDIGDFEKLVKTLYLIENDGVERKQVNVDIYEKIEISDEKADRLLEVLADDIVDAEFKEVKETKLLDNNERSEKRQNTSDPKDPKGSPVQD